MNPMNASGQSALQVTGYLLWRGGLLLAGIGGLYSLFKLVLAYWLLPTTVTTGLAFIATGFGLVMASLIAERIRDERNG
ncbi:MAG: hypothetical protein R3200_00025 [Xanthomonadales bacterium]|nr:hypothetical protein [Xanthomonadales bacterium]